MTRLTRWIVLALAVLAAGILLAAEAPRKTPVQPMSFEEAAKRHEALVREYRENTTKIDQRKSGDSHLISKWEAKTSHGIWRNEVTASTIPFGVRPSG